MSEVDGGKVFIEGHKAAMARSGAGAAIPGREGRDT